MKQKTVRLKQINRKTKSSAQKLAQVANQATAQGKLRIIGGTWRSRQLPVIDAEGLRPTTDRVRETLFNWLQTDVPGSRCLDLFAGSGALGLEAASRGAAEVVMVEKSPAVYKNLQQNIEKLAASQVKLLKQDALDYLQQLTSATESGGALNFDGTLKFARSLNFDIVFLDPPYQSALLQPVIALLALSAGTKIYLEARKGDDINVPDSWHLLKDKTAGQIHYRLYKIEE